MTRPATSPPRPAQARLRLPWLRGDALAGNSALMMFNGLLTSALGYVFWVVATHLFSASQVGLANATIAAATLVATVSDLGMRSLVMSTLPRVRAVEKWSVEVSASILVTLVSTIAGTGIAFAVLLAVHSPIVSTFSGAWALVLAVLATTQCWNFLLDGISAAERRLPGMVVRNTVLGVLKICAIGVVGVLHVTSSRAIVASVAAAVVLAAIFGLCFQLRQTQPDWRFSARGTPRSVRNVARQIVGHHVLTLSGYLPMYLTPILVVSLAGPTENAYSTLAWTLGSVFFMVSPSVGSMLFVQGRWEPGDLRSALSRSMRLVAALMLPLVVGAIALGRLVLGWFGSAYASHGYVVLVLLAVSAVPDAVTNLYTGVLRARGRVSEAAGMNAMISFAAVGLIAWLVHDLGIKGSAIGWLAAQAIGCIWVLVSATARSPFRPVSQPRHLA